jgi:HEAT repeat protein
MSLDQIALQLQSQDVKERVLAMIELQKETIAPDLALPLIKQALNDRTVQIRGMAAFSLGIKKTEENLPILVQMLTAAIDHNLRSMAAGALGYLEDPRALEPLRHAFYEDDHWLVQFSAAIALGNLKDPQAETVLLEALGSSETLLQEAAIAALGEIGAMNAIDHLLPFVESEEWLIRKRLAEALGNLPSDRAQIALQILSRDHNPQVAESARCSLMKLTELID